VLESLYHCDITNDEAKELAKKAVAAALERDPGSGNGIDVLVIPKLVTADQVVV
jgi:proteasome beta subunit